MSEIVMARADVRLLLDHLALYGLGSILGDAGARDVRLSWTPGMQPVPRIAGRDLSPELVGEAVRRHAAARVDPASWVQRDIELNGSARGLMSPRLSSLAEQAAWHRVQHARHRELDQLTDRRAWPDLRFLASLGEPCYWSHNRQGDVLQDDGASRLEMQPRNQGSEFVRTRLRQLAGAVAAREPGDIATAIEGGPSSAKAVTRTTVGLSNLVPTDNAVVWCALWGIAELPTVLRVNATAITAGHLGRSRAEWFYVPVWEAPWRPSRLRSVLATRQLRDAAATDLPARFAVEPVREIAARSWLSARGVAGIIRFPIGRFGSDSAPERRALRGVALPMGTR